MDVPLATRIRCFSSDSVGEDIVRVRICMLVSRLPEFDLLDLGRTFLYVHLQNFTLGLRLETLALSCSDVTSGGICCIIGPILSTSTFTARPLHPNTAVHRSACHRQSYISALFHTSQPTETGAERRQSRMKAGTITVCSIRHSPRI